MSKRPELTEYMNLTSNLREYIRGVKPDISLGTLKTYGSLLTSFLKNKFDREANMQNGIAFIKDTDAAIAYFDEEYADKPVSTKKTLLSALYAVDGAKAYRDEMMKYVKVHNQEMKKQEKSKTQTDNWMTYAEVMDVVEKYRKNTAPLFKSKTPLEGNDLMRAQQYVLLALTTGVFIPPRRSTDWTEMNLRNADPSNNYIEKNIMHFVTYKTAKAYGEQIVEMPNKLKLLMIKWKRLNGSDFLLVNKNGTTRMHTSRLAMELNQIFGKQVSTSMLRHIYLTEKLGHIPRLNELDKLAGDMGHTVMQQLEYIKHS